jgi:hypothetical protein
MFTPGVNEGKTILLKYSKFTPGVQVHPLGRTHDLKAGLVPGGELGVVARRAEDERVLGRERFVHQAQFTAFALEAVLESRGPML